MDDPDIKITIQPQRLAFDSKERLSIVGQPFDLKMNNES